MNAGIGIIFKDETLKETDMWKSHMVSGNRSRVTMILPKCCKEQVGADIRFFKGPQCDGGARLMAHPRDDICVDKEKYRGVQLGNTITLTMTSQFTWHISAMAEREPLNLIKHEESLK